MFVLVSCLVLLMITIAWLIIRYYSNPKESHSVASVTTLLALVCAMACVLIIPLDVMSVTSHHAKQLAAKVAINGQTTATTGLSLSWGALIPDIPPHVIHTTYHALFTVIGVIVLICIPFSYFYVEDDDDEETPAQGVMAITKIYREKSWFTKAVGALRNTVIVFVITLIVLCIIMYFKPITTVLSHASKEGVHAANKDAQGPLYKLWHGIRDAAPPATAAATQPITNADKLKADPRVQRLAAWAALVAAEYNSTTLDRLVTLAIGALCVLGLANMVMYTAYGLVALPWSLMRSADVSDAVIAAEYDIVAAQQRQQVLQSRLQDPSVTGRLRTKLSEELSDLLHAAQKTQRRRQRLQTLSSDWVHSLYVAIHPVRALVGLALAALSGVVVLALLVSVADMALHSVCGLKCGFVVDAPVLNPLDWLLVKLAPAFPLDFIVLACVSCYLFLCSMYGLVKLGVRIGPVSLFAIKPKRTGPQAMLLLSVALLASLLGLMVFLAVAAPQYASFGSQMLQAGADGVLTSQRCSHAYSVSHVAAEGAGVIEAPCVATQITQFLHRLLAAYPLFSLVFYVLEWLVLLASVLIALRFSCRAQVAVHDEEEEEDESEDEQEKM